MLAAVHGNRVVPRWRSSHAKQLVFRARHTCSRVTSGFFPPQALRLVSYESHRHQAQDQVSLQTDVMAALIVAKADLAFANPKRMLDIPTPQRHTPEVHQPQPRRSI